MNIVVRYICLIVCGSILIGLCLTDVGAQKRKRRSRRTTQRTVTTPPAETVSDESTNSDDPKIVSTADQLGTAKTSSKSKASAGPTPTPESEQDALRRSIGELAGQMNKLAEKLNQMDEQQRSLLEIERLSRAEQRAETLRGQLRDVQAKETDVQTQLDQLDFALQPENVERAVAMYGTTHPEQARDLRKKQLESQRAKVREQYTQLEQSRVKLEAAITTADNEVELLRRRTEGATQQSGESSVPLPTPTPAATPPPK